jgi:3-oxoacyl-[acyl-carrier-protein] synthase III
MVDGYAVGAGSNLALCCDLIVASDRAKFGELFCKIGLAVDGGGTWLLPRVVGMARAKELVLTGDVLDAAEAARIGLVNRVVPAAELAAATRALAEKIAAGPPLALRLDKQLLNRAATSDLAVALEAEAFAQGLASPPRTTPKGSPRSSTSARRDSAGADVNRIVGTGMAVPPCVVDNHLLARCMATSDEWIVQRTGIRERRVSPDTYRMLQRLAEAPDKTAFMKSVFADGLDGKIDSTLTVSDLGVEAAEMALTSAGITAREVDCLVASSTLPDYAYPHTGCVIQGRLGLTATPAISLQQGCAGFVYALAIADQMMRGGMYQQVLVIGAELLSSTIEAVGAGLGIPAGRLYNNVERYGNTAAASVPIALHEVVRAGLVKDGDLVLLAAFGTGFSWGATLVRW